MHPALFLFAALLLTRSMTAASRPATHLYFGTYTRTASEGIYRATFDADTGALGQPRPVARLKNPTWLAWSPDRRHLYANDAEHGAVQAYAVDPTHDTLTALNQQPTGGGHPTHLVVDATGRLLITANYGSGTVTAFPVRPDGSLGERSAFFQHEGSGPNRERQQSAHPHGVTLAPDNRFAFVPDLGTDRIVAYALDPAAATLRPHPAGTVPVEPGAGPRHLSFSRDGRHAYVINEMGGTITGFAYDATAGRLTEIQTIATLPPDFTGANKTAEIVLHPNDRYVYGSNRGHDSLAAYVRDPDTGILRLSGFTPSGGRSPRHFDVSPDGRWLITTHEDSDDVHVFRLDPATGTLHPTSHQLAVPQPVCVLFASP